MAVLQVFFPFIAKRVFAAEAASEEPPMPPQGFAARFSFARRAGAHNLKHALSSALPRGIASRAEP
jgi:hypothetical protein